MSTTEEIKSNVEAWASSNIAIKDFKFREFQEDIIVKTIFNIVNSAEQNQIIEAPTGAGKSIICLVTAGVLADYYGLKSYILCSDLYLWSQYENFISLNNLNFGILKGSRGNYVCDKNNQDISLSACKIEGLGWKTICNFKLAKSKGFDCAEICEYAIQRQKAMKSKVCVMTYALWYAHMNIVQIDPTGWKPFPARDVLFCDECHKIPELFSGFVSLTIDPIRHFPAYVNVFDYKKSVDDSFSEMTKDEFHKELVKCFENIWNSETPDSVFENYKKYLGLLQKLGDLESLAEEFRQGVNSIKLKKADLKMLNNFEYIHDVECHISDFLKVISETGVQYLVKNNNVSPKNGDKSVSFMCAKEDFLCSKCMFSHTQYTVMLSATVGQKAAFDENIGIGETTFGRSVMTKIPSTFDFSNSPIYYFTKWNMGFNHINENFKDVANAIFNIIRMYHNGQRGIIQTGSYKNSKMLYEMCPNDLKGRFLYYSNKTEKEEFLKTLEDKNDGIIIGPSLVEGIDLPDDLCRFIIIMKVPWPNMADNLTKKKMELFPKWFEDHTSKMIIQGIGRGNRHKNDWCVTYIMDNCFGKLYKHTFDEYPKEFNERLKVII